MFINVTVTNYTTSKKSTHGYININVNYENEFKTFSLVFFSSIRFHVCRSSHKNMLVLKKHFESTFNRRFRKKSKVVQVPTKVYRDI